MARRPARESGRGRASERERHVPTDEELDAELAAEDAEDDAVEDTPAADEVVGTTPEAGEVGLENEVGEDETAVVDEDETDAVVDEDETDAVVDEVAVADDEDDDEVAEADDQPVLPKRVGSRAARTADPVTSRRVRDRASVTADPTRKRNIAERLYSGELSIDFVRMRRPFYIISAVLIVASIVLVLAGRINPGIEFRGGADFQVTATTPNTADTVARYTDVVRATNLPDLEDVSVRTIGEDRIRVQTRTLDSTTEVPVVQDAIAAEAGVQRGDVAYSLIGASWGQQITQQALIALGVFLALVTLVIAIYFRNWKMSMAALIALVHDLVITVGVYAAVGFTVTPSTVIGVLTILGYSLYDTVVVFDKVRENTDNITAQTERTYAEAANLAVNQVLVRSINTTVIGVLPVGALLFAGSVVLGEGPLQDLALALFVGMIAGAYSSIFIATPLLIQMKDREPAIAKHNARVLRRRKGQPDVAPDAASSRRRRKQPVDALAAAEAEVNELPDIETGGEDPISGPTRSRDGGRAVDRRPAETSSGGAKRPQPVRRSRSGRRR